MVERKTDGTADGKKENIQGRGRKHVEMCFLGFFYLLIIKLTSKTKFENKYKIGRASCRERVFRAV